jgi:hypothetical protein
MVIKLYNLGNFYHMQNLVGRWQQIFHREALVEHTFRIPLEPTKHGTLIKLSRTTLTFKALARIYFLILKGKSILNIIPVKDIGVVLD